MSSLGWGFSVGHWTDPDAMTGCTVVIPPRGNVASCDVRGSSPGSREIAQLDLDKRLTEIHGVLLTGGSAFGLGAADGVVAWLRERGVGYETPIATVPIVPTAVVFDLGIGRSDSWPTPDSGRAACDAARTENIEEGAVGAGIGCTAGKWAGREHAAPGGVGIGRAEEGGTTVSALAVVNPIGDVVDSSGNVIAGTSASAPRFGLGEATQAPVPDNTVLALVACSGRVSKQDMRFIAARGSDGITTSVRPAHTRYDGDIVFAVAAPGEEDANVDLLGYLATKAVAAAVRRAVWR
jgi:L-aminopeptidase/D-esterase-like protein